MTAATFPPEAAAERKKIGALTANFAIALKEHLRKGVLLDELVLLTEAEKEELRHKNHIPSHISLRIHQIVQDQYQAGNISNADLLNFKPQLQALLDITGACERIKKTPIPFSYNVYLKIFITAYAVLLPMALVPEFGFWAVPIVMLIFFAFIGVELMAEEIEDPFGLDCNDLPTGDIAHGIKEVVFEILDLRAYHPIEEKENLYEKVF